MSRTFSHRTACSGSYFGFQYIYIGSGPGGSSGVVCYHIGRISGNPRRAILEVVEHDGDSYVVASGRGRTAAWYRNILHRSDVTIQVGTQTMPVTAVPLSKEEGGQVFGRYGSRHPTAAKYVFPRVLGFCVDGSDADFRAVGQHLPFVRFVPRKKFRVMPVAPSGPWLRNQRLGGSNRTAFPCPGRRIADTTLLGSLGLGVSREKIHTLIYLMQPLSV